MTNVEVIQQLYRTFANRDYQAFQQRCDRDRQKQFAIICHPGAIAL